MKKINLLIIGLAALQMACSGAAENRTATFNNAPQANNSVTATDSMPANNSSPKAEAGAQNSLEEPANQSSKSDQKGAPAAETRSKIVKFAKGATSVVYEEKLAKGEIYKFIVGAKKDQLMAVRVGTDSGEVLFDVAADGKTIPTSVDTDKWSDKLPADGKYQINVRRKSGNGNFKIEIVVE